MMKKDFNKKFFYDDITGKKKMRGNGSFCFKSLSNRAYFRYTYTNIKEIIIEDIVDLKEEK